MAPCKNINNKKGQFHSLVYKYLLCACYVSDTVQGAGETAVNRKDNSSFAEHTFRRGQGDERKKIKSRLCCVCKILVRV